MLKAIISDIHGNIPAFLAVLDDISSLGSVEVFCAGDIVGYGSSPRECLDIVREKAIESVMGNHDAASVGMTDITSFNEWAKEAVRWTGEQLEDADRRFLEGLPYVIGKEGFTMAHGTLHRPEEFMYMMDISDAAETFRVLDSKVCFVGHSHVPGVFAMKGNSIRAEFKKNMSFDPDANYIVNVGSVGQPRDGDPRACYCLFDPEKQKAEFRRVEYDVRSAREGILRAALPRELGDRLLTGR